MRRRSSGGRLGKGWKVLGVVSGSVDWGLR